MNYPFSFQVSHSRNWIARGSIKCLAPTAVINEGIPSVND